MKQSLRTIFFLGLFLLSLTSLVAASDKWGYLNLLKSVTTNKVDDGLIVRLEFEKPVGEYKEPVFFEKSVQIDFPFAFIKPAKKYFPSESLLLTKVFAAQFDADTLRVRFLKKDKSNDLQGRFHLAQQGRFVIVRVDSHAPALKAKPAIVSEVRAPANNELMTEDELAVFLAQASEKIRNKKDTQTLNSDAPEKASIPVPTKEKENIEPSPAIKVTRAGMGVEPIVEQIKKATQKKSTPEKSVDGKKSPSDSFTRKSNTSFSLKESRPTGKPIELIPSSLRMLSMLAVVLGIMFLLFFGFKKYVLKNTVFGGGEKLVNVLGSGFLAPKKNIVLVEVAGEVLVLGMSQDNISMLTHITDPERIEDIKSKGGKGGSGLNWNGGNSAQKEAGTASMTGQFSNYMKKFSNPEKNNKDKSVADITAQIRQQMGRFKNARA
ncbi:MAG: FliO/MopB family protein [Nitrospina sp.]|nr:FliO/MopB family protein [Nitrospina sp.]